MFGQPNSYLAAPDVGGNSAKGSHDSVLVVDQIIDLREQLAQIDMGRVHPTELGELIAQLAGLRNQIDAMDVRAVGIADKTDQWKVDGARSLSAWISQRSRCTKTIAGARLGIARTVELLPQLTAAFNSGTTSFEHMRLVARQSQQHPLRRELMSDADEIFTRIATSGRPDRLKVLVNAWAERVDAQGLYDGYLEQRDLAFLHASPLMDGMVRVDGMLDAETGSALLTALAAARDILTPTADSVDRAPVSKLNVDALRHVLGIAMRNDQMPTAHDGLPVTLIVTTTVEDLRMKIDAAGGQLKGVGDIPAATVRRLACESRVIPVVMNSRSEVLDTGRAKRIVTRAQRVAIEVRDRHCRWPGCDYQIENVHHLQYWEHGGRSDMPNMAGLCLAHHRSVHEGGMRLTGNANEKLVAEGRLRNGITPHLGDSYPYLHDANQTVQLICDRVKAPQ